MRKVEFQFSFVFILLCLMAFFLIFFSFSLFPSRMLCIHMCEYVFLFDLNLFISWLPYRIFSCSLCERTVFQFSTHFFPHFYLHDGFIFFALIALVFLVHNRPLIMLDSVKLSKCLFSVGDVSSVCFQSPHLSPSLFTQAESTVQKKVMMQPIHTPFILLGRL